LRFSQTARERAVPADMAFFWPRAIITNQCDHTLIVILIGQRRRRAEIGARVIALLRRIDDIGILSCALKTSELHDQFRADAFCHIDRHHFCCNHDCSQPSLQF